MSTSKLARPRRTYVQRIVGTPTVRGRGGQHGEAVGTGWYPDPNGKWETTSTWTARNGTPRRHLHRLPGARKWRIWPWLLGIVFVLVLIGRCSDSGNQSSQTSPSASPTRSASPTCNEAFPTGYLPGNGTYEMGGIDGKDWG